MIYKTLEKFKTLIENDGYIVYAIALKGSQNYNLHDEFSDIDANAVIIPNLRQIRSGFKKKYTLLEGECTVHDIYSFATIVAKGNPQWIEVCHTDYIIGNLDIFKHYKINPSALKGMLFEKINAFDRLYPSREKYVKKFGYDPKQLHHIIRLYDLMKNDVPIYKYTDKEREFMLDIKRGRYPSSKEKAFKMMYEYKEKLLQLYENKKLSYEVQHIDYETIDKIVLNYMCNKPKV